MWGVSQHGKNHSRAMGCHRASYLPYLSSALIFCLSSSSAVQDVNIVQSVLLNVYDSSVYSTLYSISADTYGMASDVFSILQRMQGIEDSADGVSYNINRLYNLIDSVIIEQDNYLSTRDTQVADKLDTLIDTNQYYLSAILDALNRPIASYTMFNANYIDNPSQSFQNNLSDLQDDSIPFWDKFAYYGIWANTPLAMAYEFDIRQLDGGRAPGTSIGFVGEQKTLMDFWSTFMDVSGLAWYETISDKVGPFAALKMKYYGTYHITDALTNTVLTVDSNGHTVTNQALLDQILSSAQYQALYRDNINQFTNGVVPTLGNAVDANTNGMFVGVYSDLTNANMLASITTNDYLNTDYDAFSADLDQDNLNGKLYDAGFADFDSKLDDVFSDTVSALEAAQDNVWVIRLGNVELGDFSYTIPDITVYRSDSWMALMRKFFEALKAICTIAFFLFLWNKLRQVAAETS